MDLLAAFEAVSTGIEAAAVLAIVIGGVLATARFGRALFRSPFDAAYHEYRRGLGRSILLGLELLVAADLIRTVLIRPGGEGLVELAVIVALRIVLSIALEVEMEGRWPWQRSAGKSTPQK
jgi:uncharacterized membrane protein